MAAQVVSSSGDHFAKTGYSWFDPSSTHVAFEREQAGRDPLTQRSDPFSQEIIAHSCQDGADKRANRNANPKPNEIDAASANPHQFGHNSTVNFIRSPRRSDKNHQNCKTVLQQCLKINLNVTVTFYLYSKPANKLFLCPFPEENRN